jgi:hypothetical protein
VNGIQFLLIVAFSSIGVWIAYVWRKAGRDIEAYKRRDAVRREAGEMVAGSGDDVAAASEAGAPGPSPSPGSARQPADLEPGPAEAAKTDDATLSPELSLLRQEIAALAARAEDSDAGRNARLAPELAALRTEVAQLSALVGRPSEDVGRDRVATEIEALRADLAALAARVQVPPGTSPEGPDPAIPAEPPSPTPSAWSSVLRPVAALGVGVLSLGIVSLVAMLPDRNVRDRAADGAPSLPSRVDTVGVPAPVAGAPAQAPAAVSSGTRVALVIGNGAYRSVARLPNPGRDAEAVASAFRRVGFRTVTRQADLTREKMNDVLRAFAAETERADWAVIYYAGHGIEVGGNNYLVPVDARLAFDRDVPFEAVPLDHLMNAVGGAKKLRIVLLDACRDNPFVNQMQRTAQGRSIGRGLAQIEPDAGTLVVFAAKHGQIALDGEAAQNSPFAAALVGRLTTPGLEVRRLFDHVRDDVIERTGRRQQPFSYGSLPGREDFYFVAR